VSPAGRQLSITEVRELLAVSQGDELAVLLRRFSADERSGVVELCRRAKAREDAIRTEAERTEQLYALEQSLRASGFVAIAGVDEVGRGALAGPVSAGAVILLPGSPILRLNDSKKLSPTRREEIALLVHEHAVAVGIGHVPASEIDAIGLSAALRKAMRLALSQLSPTPDHVIVDGIPLGIHLSETAVVKGDSKIAAVAAASIVAKVSRDALMREAAVAHPVFGFEVNKGYGTAEHIAAVAEFGPCELHRQTFCGGGGNPTLF
jgi:ribonuclease HII